MARKKDTFASVSDGFDFSSEDIEEEIIVEQPHIEPKKITTSTTEKKKAGRPVGSARKSQKEKVQHFSTSLPPDIIEALNEQAIKEDRPISKVVARAIRYYIDNN